MTDRELLELAAKAAGYALGEFWTPYLGAHHGQHWNPLDDDGDALRLAVKLHIDVMFYPSDDERVVQACIPAPGNPDEGWTFTEGIGKGDDVPATRRAIVRAAAEIGKRGA